MDIRIEIEDLKNLLRHATMEEIIRYKGKFNKKIDKVLDLFLVEKLTH